jgi:hypothetical protein
MTDNCYLCGRFMSDFRDDDMHCNECLKIIIAEYEELETGIGTGQIQYPDENYCRHCIKKWPMSETVFNAVYGVSN